MQPVSFRELQGRSFEQNFNRFFRGAAARPPVHLRDHPSPEDMHSRDVLRLMEFQRAPIEPAAVTTSAPDATPMSYEELLALDENNVSRGINTRTQRGILRDVQRPPATQDCAVCQESFRGSHAAGVVTLPCQHLFHFACISPWLERDRRCPTCRKEVCERPSQ
jgi:hypothetical protein